MAEFKEIAANASSLSRRRLVFGVGINDAEYVVNFYGDAGLHLVCPVYQTWKSMLQRCYYRQTLQQRPSYEGCFVCDSWLKFSTFRKWMLEQPWRGKELDKDILFPGNKEYSPKTCRFVTQQLNALLVNVTGKEYPGVYPHNKKWRALLSIEGKVYRLGVFPSKALACKAYCKVKARVIRGVALSESDPKVVQGLIAHAALLEEKFNETL